MHDTHENPTSLNDSPPASGLAILVQALAHAIGWVANLPASALERAWNRAVKVWDWVKGLPTMKAHAVAIWMAAEGQLAIDKAKALEIEERARSEARHRDAETELLRVEAERKRQDMAFREKVTASILDGGNGSVDYHDDNVQVHVGASGKKFTALPTKSAKPEANGKAGANGKEASHAKTIERAEAAQKM